MHQKWLYVPKPNPQAKIKLFCFHFAGGSAQSFRNMALQLDSSIELNAIQLPGHGERLREGPYKRMPDLIENLIPAIQEAFDRPYCLLGQSLGGLIAFESARKLRELNLRSPSQMILASRPAPHITAQSTSYDLSDADFLDALESRYGALPGREILEDPEIRELLLPVLKTDMEVYETYNFKECAPFDFSIAAFKGTDDLKLLKEDVNAWKSLTTKNFFAKDFSGGHFFWQKNEAQFAAEVQRLLNF